MKSAAGTPLSDTSAMATTDSAVLKLDDVEEVPTHVAGRLHVGEDAAAWSVGEVGGQDRLLYLAGHAELVLQRHQLVPRLESFAPFHQVLQRARDGELQVVEVNRLGDKVEGSPIHGRAYVLHIAIGRDDHRADIGLDLGDLLDQRESVHLGHVDVGEHQVYVRLFLEPVEGFQAILGKDELVEAGANIPTHSLKHEPFQIRLVVDNQYLVLPTRPHLSVCPASGEPIALPETLPCSQIPASLQREERLPYAPCAGRARRRAGGNHPRQTTEKVSAASR